MEKALGKRFTGYVPVKELNSDPPSSGGTHRDKMSGPRRGPSSFTDYAAWEDEDKLYQSAKNGASTW